MQSVEGAACYAVPFDRDWLPYQACLPFPMAAKITSDVPKVCRAKHHAMEMTLERTYRQRWQILVAP